MFNPEFDDAAEALLEWFGDNVDRQAFNAAKMKFHSAERRLQALLRTR